MALVLAACQTDPCTGWTPQTFKQSEVPKLSSETKRIALKNNLYGKSLGCPAFR